MKPNDYLVERIYGEYQAYKASILGLSNGEIFTKCYEIDVMTNFYEILLELVGNLSEEAVSTLLKQRNILTELYQKWLKKADSAYEELENHVRDEIGMLKA